MTPLSCSQVEEQIELYAAGECEAPLRAAIEQHLAHCPVCARSLEESQRLIGLLDLHGQQADGLRRLHARIAEEARPRRARRVVQQIWQPMRALAALLLVTLGLTWWLSPLRQSEPDMRGQLVLTLRSPPFRAKPENMAVGIGLPQKGDRDIAAKAGSETLRYPLDTGGLTAQAFRRQLRPGANAADLPKPPQVNLVLEIHNRGAGPLHVWLGGRYSRLTVNLRGPGVVSIPVRGGELPLPKSPQPITLAPGESYFLPIPRLVCGSGSEVEYVYWTEPGKYTLAIELRTRVCRDENGVERCVWQTIAGRPMAVEIRPQQANGRRQPAGTTRSSRLTLAGSQKSPGFKGFQKEMSAESRRSRASGKRRHQMPGRN
jgi:hypothetical protein